MSETAAPQTKTASDTPAESNGKNKRKNSRRQQQRKRRLVVKLTSLNPDAKLTEEQAQVLEKMKKKKEEKEKPVEDKKPSKKRKREAAEKKTDDKEGATKKKKVKDKEEAEKKEKAKKKKEKEEAKLTPEEKAKLAKKVEAEKLKIKRRTVIVGNFPYGTTTEQLKDYFTDRAGKVKTVSMSIYKKTGLSKGYAKVIFKHVEGVGKAVALDRTDFNGRKLLVKIPGQKRKPVAPAKETENVQRSKTIHVAGFDDGATKEDFEKFFAPTDAGPIKEVRMFSKMLDGEPHNIAFVQFWSWDGLESAVKLHGTKFNGRPVKIKYAVENKRVPPPPGTAES